MKEFLKTTLIGGAIFLVPVALLLGILGHALKLAIDASQPVLNVLHFDKIGKVAGVGLVTAVAVILLVLVSFFAGLVARTRAGSRVSGWFEKSFLGNLPQYQAMRSIAQELAQAEGASEEFKPVLVRGEGSWQIGYLIEPIENGWLAVFVPQAPKPMTGHVRYFPADRVRTLDITMLQARAIVKNIGVGSAAALRSADLGQPSV